MTRLGAKYSSTYSSSQTYNTTAEEEQKPNNRGINKPSKTKRRTLRRKFVPKLSQSKQDFIDLVGCNHLTNTFLPPDTIANPVLRELYSTYLHARIPGFASGDYKLWFSRSDFSIRRFIRSLRVYIGRKTISHSCSRFMLRDRYEIADTLEELNIKYSTPLFRFLFDLESDKIPDRRARGLCQRAYNLKPNMIPEIFSNEIFFQKVFNLEFLLEVILPRLNKSTLSAINNSLMKRIDKQLFEIIEKQTLTSEESWKANELISKFAQKMEKGIRPLFLGENLITILNSLDDMIELSKDMPEYEVQREHLIQVRSQLLETPECKRFVGFAKKRVSSKPTYFCRLEVFQASKGN